LTDFEVDLATIIARLEQVQDEGGFEVANTVVVERILTCDLPRLRRHREGKERERAEHERQIRNEIAAAITSQVCAPSPDCNPYCPDCIRWRQAQRDAAIARGAA